MTTFQRYVRAYKKKASRIEIREIVLSTPAGKKASSACHALQSARIAPRPRSMCTAGLHVSDYLLFCRKALVRRERLAKVRKFDKHTYTYTYIRCWPIGLFSFLHWGGESLFGDSGIGLIVFCVSVKYFNGF